MTTIIKITDNGGKTSDRYSVYLSDGYMLLIDEHGAFYSDNWEQDYIDNDNDKELKFEELSKDIQDSINGFINEPESVDIESLRPERYKLWNVYVKVGEHEYRILVGSDEENYAETVELRVKSYYESICKHSTKSVVKATLSKRTPIFIY